MNEPEVTINGVKLNYAQSMCLRVALTSFHFSMAEPDALGTDTDINVLYAKRCAEIERAMFLNLNDGPLSGKRSHNPDGSAS